MIDDEELTQRLSRAGARQRSVAVVPPGTVSLLVADTRRRAESRSLRRKMLAGIGSVAVLGSGIVAAPAAAEVIQQFLAQTGIVFGGSEVIEDSEFVDTSASDLGAYLESIYPEDLPLAPGQTPEGVIEHVRAERSAQPGITQKVDLVRSLEHAAYIGWIDEWIAANEVGDTERMATAAAMIADAATWPAFVATDAGGVTYMMSRYAEAVAAGDVDAAQELAQVEGADSWDGVDRAEQPGSYSSRFYDEYEAAQ